MAVSPANNAPLGSISNATVRLDWTPMTGATWYYVEVYGTFLPGVWAVNINDIDVKPDLITLQTNSQIPKCEIKQEITHIDIKKEVDDDDNFESYTENFLKVEIKTEENEDIKEELEEECGKDEQINWEDIAAELLTILEQTIESDAVARNYIKGAGDGFKAWQTLVKRFQPRTKTDKMMAKTELLRPDEYGGSKDV